MKIQQTNWGRIEWIHLEHSISSRIGMNVGIVVLRPKAILHAHIHYDSQVLYYIEGEGINSIDGVEEVIEINKLYVLPTGVIHEVINTGEKELKHLMVSKTIGFTGLDDQYFINFLNAPEKIHETKNDSLLYMAVEGIRTQFLDNLNYHYTISSMRNELVKKSESMPKYCLENCSQEFKKFLNPCIKNLNIQELSRDAIFVCPYGVNVISVPIYYNSMQLGLIQGGYFQQIKDSDIYELPESTIQGIRSLLRKISKAVSYYFDFVDFKKELDKRELVIDEAEETKRNLQKLVKQADSMVLDLKIDNHFLFNSLNSMASMAIENDQWDIYDSIIHLSKLFRYSTRHTQSLVYLRDEMEYLKSYLELQKIRYKEYLSIVYDIDTNALSKQVPFNFLQPIAENSFKYGFKSVLNKIIDIKILLKKNTLIIRIKNNGNIPTNIELKKINEGMKSTSSHALSMIYQKLTMHFGDEFTIKFQEVEEFGIECEICINYA